MAGAESGDARAGAPEPDDDRLRRVRELLDELSPQERQELLRAGGRAAGPGSAEETSEDGAEGSEDGANAADPEEPDESEAFYAGLEDDDDLIGSKLASRRAKRGKDEPPESAGSTPRRRAPLSSAERIALIAAVVLGIAAAIWYSNVGGVSSGSPHGGAMASAGAQGGASKPGTEQWAAEVSTIQSQIEADPTNADLKIRLGRAYAGLGDYDRAIETLTGVTDEDPAKTEAWYYLGFIHMSTKPPNEAAAQAAWQKVIDLDPDSEMAGKARSHMANLGSQGGTAGPQGSPAAPTGSATATAEAAR
ncbi:tetratricopeptide repeat protein [Actinomyces sp. zg328]|uniref:tetratricopeptide repeat protein n=1 Tax=Actinomyces sp. zg328 TaxID=2609287 RepID=UPI00135A2858|nr:tetratricopeptide repeat protein [Actinomyces sp. zg328]